MPPVAGPRTRRGPRELNLAPSDMSRVDLAWLRMDSASNRMVIVGVWLIEPALSLQALRERVAERLLCYERFGCKVVLHATGAQWVPDTDFDLDCHVVAQSLPGGQRSPRAALQALCGELAALPLDPARPLWQFHLIENFDGGSAMVARIHHCIADGIALIGVMQALTDGGEHIAAAAAKARGRPGAGGAVPSPSRSDGPADWLGSTFVPPLAGMALKALGLRSVAPAAGMHLLSDLAALALMPEDSPTLLKRTPMGAKAVAWCEPLPLDEVKAVGHAFGVSVNDVLLACAAGAIGGWLAALGDAPQGKSIRAMVPVNLRPAGETGQLGNRFGLAPLLLPIGEANPVARLYAVHARMVELKGSSQPVLAFALLAATGLLAQPMQEAVIGLFSKKATAVMTNVPGPREPLRIGGRTIRQALFWVPASGDIGVGVSILSYAGGVQFGLIVDRALCAAPQAIADRFEPEFKRLLTMALVLPWVGKAA